MSCCDLKQKQRGGLAVILPPLFLGSMTASPPLGFRFMSQQLIVRHAARQDSPAGEQDPTFTKQQDTLLCTFRLTDILSYVFSATRYFVWKAYHTRAPCKVPDGREDMRRLDDQSQPDSTVYVGLGFETLVCFLC